MAFCYNCGITLDLRWKFCPVCGVANMLHDPAAGPIDLDFLPPIRTWEDREKMEADLQIWEQEERAKIVARLAEFEAGEVSRHTVNDDDLVNARIEALRPIIEEFEQTERERILQELSDWETERKSETEIGLRKFEAETRIGIEIELKRYTEETRSRVDSEMSEYRREILSKIEADKTGLMEKAKAANLTELRDEAKKAVDAEMADYRSKSREMIDKDMTGYHQRKKDQIEQELIAYKDSHKKVFEEEITQYRNELRVRYENEMESFLEKSKKDIQKRIKKTTPASEIMIPEFNADEETTDFPDPLHPLPEDEDLSYMEDEKFSTEDQELTPHEVAPAATVIEPDFMAKETSEPDDEPETESSRFTDMSGLDERAVEFWNLLDDAWMRVFADALNKEKIDIRDIPAILSLKKLDVSGSEIANLEPISYIGDLEQLDCHQTVVNSLVPLKELKEIYYLNAGKTLISDVKALRFLRKLKTLILNDTDVEFIAPLENCPRMEKVDLSGTRVKSIEALMPLTKLQEVRLPGTVYRADVDEFKHTHLNCRVLQ